MADTPMTTYKPPDDLDYLQAIDEAFSTAMITIQFQDKARTDQALMQAKTAFKKLSPGVENNLRLIAEGQVNYIELVAALLKMTLYQAEAKIEKAVEQYKNALSTCRSGFGLMQQLVPQYEDENEKKILLGYLFKIFELFIEGLGLALQMQIDRKQGKFVSEPEVLKQTVATWKKIEELDFINVPAIIALRESFAQQAGIYENTIERLLNEQKTISFLPPLARKVFIIHGHDEGNLRLLENMLEDEFKLDVVVLKDEANLGDSVIEKFEEMARFCGYAIAVLSPDDIIKNKNTKYFQAMPNVLFEMGWFCGRFGRARVCIVKQKQLQLPSDLGGVITLEYHESVEELEGKLKKELTAAGILV